MEASVQVQGVKETLKIMRQVEPELRKQLYREMRTAAKPLVTEIQSRLPAAPPLDNWSTGGRLGWNATAVRRSVKLKIGGKKVRSQRGTEFPLLRVVVGSPAAAMYDMAGRGGEGNTPQGQQFVQLMNSGYGRASRTAWPSAEKRLPDIQRGVLEAIDKAAAQINREITRVN